MEERRGKAQVGGEGVEEGGVQMGEKEKGRKARRAQVKGQSIGGKGKWT